MSNQGQPVFQADNPDAVTELRCCKNRKIASLPAGIEKLSHLRRLNLSNTSIDSIPSSLADLKDLSVIDLTGTPIKDLPEAILQCSHPLTIILLDCNKIVRSNFRHVSPNVTLVLQE